MLFYHKKLRNAIYYQKEHNFVQACHYYDENEEIVIPVEKLTPADVLNIANDTFIGIYGNDPERKNKLVSSYGAETHRKVQDIMNILYR